jgi:hypothetical protein
VRRDAYARHVFVDRALDARGIGIRPGHHSWLRRAQSLHERDAQTLWQWRRVVANSLLMVVEPAAVMLRAPPDRYIPRLSVNGFQHHGFLIFGDEIVVESQSFNVTRH